MPCLTRYFIKAGLLYFGGGLALVFLSNLLALDEYPWLASATPVYFHMIMVGWITQIIMGVSFWMFPALARDNPRGNERLGWLAWAGINLGMMARMVGEPLSASGTSVFPGLVLILSALLQWLGGLAYVVLIWPRVKGK
ncbi:MAG: hypothetical protein KDC45_11985 [Bacteroidetes bacterium]|nr:hypothetical protein [Bacteroidota bacterium]